MNTTPFKYSFLLLLTIGFILPLNLSSQQLEFDEIQVIAPYEPTISDAFKMNFNPQIEDTLQVDIDFEYRISPTQIPVKFELEPLTAARMRGEPLKKLYKGYVKGGIGNYSTPYGEVFYNTLRSNEYHYGVHLKHLSSGGGIEDYAHNGYSDNKINLYGKRFLRNHTLSADLNYKRNMVHFYGFKPDDFPDNDSIQQLGKKDIRQRFNFVSPSVSLSSNYLDSTKLQHSIDLSYHYLADSYDASEQWVGLTADLGKSLQDDPMGFADEQSFNIGLSAEYFNNHTHLDDAHTGLFKITPTFRSRFNNFDFYVGVNAAIQADTVSHMRFYPLAGAEVNLVNDILFAYASLSGDLTKNTMAAFSERNPFMQTSTPYAFTNKRSKIKGGLRGSISSFASYNVSISNSNIDNQPFFVTNFDSPLANRFDIIYDDIRLFNLRTEVFSNVGERIKIRLASDYYQYSMDNELEPWHEPTMTISLNLTYNIQDKILLHTHAYSRDKVYARVLQETSAGIPEPAREKLHGFHVDLNFGVEYRYTKILSVFVNFNNVQNQSLQRWYNYPSQRFNVLGGITYAF